MEEIDNVKKLITSLNNSLTDLHGKLNGSITSKPITDQIIDIQNKNSTSDVPLKKVELYNTISYTLTSLYFSYLKSKGLNTKNDHPIMAELNRVKSYMNRSKSVTEKEEAKEQRKKIDTEAAKRFIQQQFNAKVASANEPAVSKVHFEGKHTKFSNDKKKQQLSTEDKKSLKVGLDKKKHHGKKSGSSSSKGVSKKKSRKA